MVALFQIAWFLVSCPDLLSSASRLQHERSPSSMWNTRYLPEVQTEDRRGESPVTTGLIRHLCVPLHLGLRVHPTGLRGADWPRDRRVNLTDLQVPYALPSSRERGWKGWRRNLYSGGNLGWGKTLITMHRKLLNAIFLPFLTTTTLGSHFVAQSMDRFWVKASRKYFFCMEKTQIVNVHTDNGSFNFENMYR